MRPRKSIFLDTNTFGIPRCRRIPKVLALVISVTCISVSALLGLWAHQTPFFSDVVGHWKEKSGGYVHTSSFSSKSLFWDDFSSGLKVYADYEVRSDIVPENAPGELGVPVSFASFGRKAEEARSVFGKEAFNLMASDIISLQRRLPELRGSRCLTEQHDSALPSTSVIIVFFNEPLSSLLRTVWSVINRSRPEILREVIMVDDASDRVELKTLLDNYVSLHFGGKVRVLRAPIHKGLIQGKIAGARNASGEVLVFLDSHCEANRGWLEPLLSRIRANPKLVACPLVDTIVADDLGYSPSANWATGLFTWSLYYKWGPESMTAAEIKRVKDPSFEPHRTPAFPGGLFAIDRKWFFKVGAYDEQMEGWGGENLEMSFRIWMCGGSLEFVPCSRVGHVARTHTYSPAEEDKNHAFNSARLAEVWMDDYKRFFYMARPAMKAADIGNLTSRLALRKQLKCHSFKWYLENVFAEKFIPDEQSKKLGQLLNIGTNFCLNTVHNDEHSPSKFSAHPCVRDSEELDYLLQIFALSTDDELRREEWCLDGNETLDENQQFKLQSFVCNAERRRTWTYTSDRKLRNVRTGLCLHVNGEVVTLQTCGSSANQEWQFQKLATTMTNKITLR